MVVSFLLHGDCYTGSKLYTERRRFGPNRVRLACVSSRMMDLYAGAVCEDFNAVKTLCRVRRKICERELFAERGGQVA